MVAWVISTRRLAMQPVLAWNIRIPAGRSTVGNNLTAVAVHKPSSTFLWLSVLRVPPKHSNRLPTLPQDCRAASVR